MGESIDILAKHSQLENAVYLHLRRRGYQVFVGKVLDVKVDFVAQKGDERVYYQVCYLLTDEAVIEREYGALEKIRDSYRKIVLSMDDEPFGPRNGIEHKLAWEALASD